MGLNGIDTASYQKGLVPKNMPTTQFNIVKFTQGTWYVNPYRVDQYGNSKAENWYLGAYHYAEGGDPVKEAQFFIREVGARAGECILALDWEGRDNKTFGTGKDVQWVYDFCEEVYRLTGVRCFVYMSKSVCRKYNWKIVADKYPLWCAQYGSNNRTDYQSNPWTDNGGWGKWDSDTIRQYSSKGNIKGYGANIDINLAYLTGDEWLALAAGEDAPVVVPVRSRQAIVDLAKSKIGIKEGSSGHRAIIDRYNAQAYLPRGYKVKYTDAWCATFVSYLAVELGYTDIIPTECSCPRIIELAKQMGIWVEDDAYEPSPGDIVLYDWQDSGKGDNTGTADHIGVVTEMLPFGFKVTEGNIHDSVDTRDMDFDGRYIRGFIVPRYTNDEVITDDVHMVKWTGKMNRISNVYMQPSTKSAQCSFSPVPQDAEIGVCKGYDKFYLIRYGAKFGYVHKSHVTKLYNF